MVSLDALGCTSAKQKQFNEKNIWSAEDLIMRLPTTYYDFREPKNTDTVYDGEVAALIGVVESVKTKLTITGSEMVTFDVRDVTSRKFFHVMYFNASYMINKIPGGIPVFFGGHVQVRMFGSNRYVSMTNPPYVSQNPKEMMKLIPQYRKIPGMSVSYYNDTLHKALMLTTMHEYLQPEVVQKAHLVPYEKLPYYIHSPKDEKEIQASERRLVFDDLFYFNFMLKSQQDSGATGISSPLKFESCSMLETYLKSLPFALTKDQMSAIETMRSEGETGKKIHALLQGDVGYGKTEVAKALALMTVENGAQAVILAPTTVLAEQHFKDFSDSFSQFGINVVLLANTLKKKERNALLKRIASGEAQVIVGTHSVFSKDVEYKKIGSIVVDEEHRFGVEQREMLNERAGNDAHRLSMSATPIPRTLALSLYGDSIEVMELTTAPAHKKPITTLLKNTLSDIAPIIYEQLEQKHQCYVVCPLIQQGDSERTKNLDSVEETYEEYTAEFARYGYTIGKITGKMKKDEASAVLDEFVAGSIDILIATTIVEVGVNVPNATVMILNNAERYGLAQIHQLRGRVGRGSAEGICILLYNGQVEEVKDRLSFMCQTTNGFEIAHKDLGRRGAGNIIGIAQTGDSRYLTLIMGFPKFNDYIRNLVNYLYNDPVNREYYLRQLHSRYENETEEEKADRKSAKKGGSR